MDLFKIKQILAFVFMPHEIAVSVLMCTKIIVADAYEQQRLISEYHNSLVGGHLGIKKCTLKMGERYQWKGMARQIKKYIRKCPDCQKNKHGKNTRMPLQIFTTPKKPFDVIAIDIVGPMPTTANDNKYFLSVQCNFSKYIVLIPLINQEASTVAKALAERVLLVYGLPRCLFSDLGTNFQSKLFKKLCNLLRIKQIRTTPFAPWSNGSCERVHRGIKEAPRTYINKDFNDWDMFLPHIAFCYNSSIHSATKYSPFELVFGQKAEIPISTPYNYELITFYDDYVSEFKNKHKLAIQLARENIEKSKNIQKIQYDKHINPVEFKQGDLVLIKTHSPKKLSSLFHGPYEVLERISDTNTKILVKNKPKMLHNNNIKLYVA
jgi:transposase InsO family protein